MKYETDAAKLWAHANHLIMQMILDSALKDFKGQYQFKIQLLVQIKLKLKSMKSVCRGIYICGP